MILKRIYKVSVGPHHGSIKNRKSFDEAYEAIKSDPDRVYYSAGNSAPFIGKAYIATKGTHKGQKAITFKRRDSKTISAYAYYDCWGKKTNCYG
jgi:hypothetical protein